MYYKLQDGTLIEVGKQNLVDATVPVEINNQQVICPLFSDDLGNIGFIIHHEEVLFHWLKYESY